MPQKLNLLLLAGDSAGVRLLRALADTEHTVRAVLTPNRPPPGSLTSLATIATRLGYEAMEGALVKGPSFAATVRQLEVDLILNVRTPFVIHEQVLRAARLGGFNMHTGPLPRYAGRNCVNWAIYRGESTYGVTVHRLEAAIDTGAVAYQATFALSDDDTGLTVTEKCIKQGIPLVLQLLETAAIDPDRIPARGQDRSQREYFSRDSVPEGGRLLWTRPARQIVNFIRACDYLPYGGGPWGHPRTLWRKQLIGVARGRRTGVPSEVPPGTVGAITDDSILIASSDELVAVESVQVDGIYRRAADLLESGERLE